jgi:hypothetical protein
MKRAEEAMRTALPGPASKLLAPGRRVYVETSSKAKYEPTRAFYVRCGYAEEARFRGFYAEDDDKVVYVKSLSHR